MKALEFLKEISAIFNQKEYLERSIELGCSKVEIYDDRLYKRVVLNGKDIAYFTAIKKVNVSEENVEIRGIIYNNYYPEVELLGYVGEIEEVEIKISKEGNIEKIIL